MMIFVSRLKLLLCNVFLPRKNKFNSFHTNNFIFIVEMRGKVQYSWFYQKWTCHTNLMNQLTYKCKEKACGIIIFQLKQVIQITDYKIKWACKTNIKIKRKKKSILLTENVSYAIDLLTLKRIIIIKQNKLLNKNH